MAVKATVKTQVDTIKNGAKYQVIKNHLDINKKFYVGFGVGALVVLATRKPPVRITNTVAPVFHI